MNRRHFLQQASAAATGCIFFPTWTHAAGETMARHLAARVVSAPVVPLPEGKREPFGWKTAAIGAVPMVLAWTDFPADAKATALPFAALAKLDPQSPLLDYAVTSLLKRKDAEGCIQDGQHTSSEGAYTVGYPLAVIAAQRKDDALEQVALDQLSVRQARLFDGRSFWRTSETKDGAVKKGNRAWARGFAWQFLGYARTLREIKHRSDLAPHIAAFQQLAAWVLPHQRPDGLWSVILDKPELTPDTSGSAGIAAALAIGAQQGWLDGAAKFAAAKTLTGLKRHLTADGMLGGVSQANKSTEDLQRGTYRVIYQMGMGLMAQLIAALEK